MSSGKKELPKSRKWVTASARARISVTKARKVVNKESNGSYLGNKETVSNLPPVTQPSTSSHNSDTIMTMLYQIRDSNADLARRLDKVERRNSTPITSQSHSLGQPLSPQLGPSHQPQQLGIPTHRRDHLTLPRMGQPHLHSHTPLAHDLVQTQVPREIKHQTSNAEVLSRAQEQPSRTHSSDAIMPNLHTLRTNPGIS